MTNENRYDSKLLNPDNEAKYYKKGAIFLIGNMSDYGVSEILMEAREIILGKEGYYVYNPIKIIPYNSSEGLRNRVLVGKLMECKKAYVMHGWEKSPVNHIIVDLIGKLKYEIIYEEDESTNT